MFEFDDAPKRLKRLIYASRATGPAHGFSELVRQILLRSIHNNRMADVTGFLVVGDGRFLQVLEGPGAAVEATFARIRQDDRHADLVVLAEDMAERRLFRDWNMGQHVLGARDAGLLAEVGLDAFTPERLDAEGAQKLLSALGARHLR